MGTFNVRLSGKLIGSVTYEGDVSADEVRESLINHDGYDPQIKVTRRTQLVHVVQGNYGQGWEDLTADTDYRRALSNLKDYRQNDPAPVRLIKRREKI